jgi:hypothetical protein
VIPVLGECVVFAKVKEEKVKENESHNDRVVVAAQQEIRRPMGGALLVIVSTGFGLVLWLLVDSLVISHFLLDPDSERQAYLLQDHGWYTLAPSVRAAAQWGKAIYPLSTDSNGFRNDPLSPPSSRPADILFLGDSFTFGINGPWDETFVGIFEKKTHKAVVNAGVGSYSPTPYLYQYKHALSAGALRTPHTVIVGLDISDVQDEAAVWQDGENHPEKQPKALALLGKAFDRFKQPSPLKAFIRSNFRATRSIYHLLFQARVPVPSPDYVFNFNRSAFTWKDWNEIQSVTDSEDPYERLGYQPGGVRGGLAKIREKLTLISQLAQENSSNMWILIYPWPAQLRYSDAVFDWQKFNTSLCEEIRCRGVINTFPIFRAQARGIDWYDRFYIRGDVHFNALGNQIIADTIIAKINSSR